jgi:hypothetical protein
MKTKNQKTHPTNATYTTKLIINYLQCSKV